LFLEERHPLSKFVLGHILAIEAFPD